MTKRVEAAIDAARTMLKREGVSSWPVPVEQIARRQGITVQSIPLDDELSGMSFVRGGVSVIVVNSAHHPNRQRFTMAHELAHHVLHKGYLADHVHVDKGILRRDQRSSEGADIKEIEANAFAAELLMPKACVRQFQNVDINDDFELAQLAKKFKVSASAMAIRLDNLD